MSTNSPRGADCLLIGGGLASLTAAVSLARHGLTCTVLEGDVRLGGRAQSWKDSVTGDSIDLGPHILLNTYDNMRRYLNLLGTESEVEWQTDAMIHKVEGQKLVSMTFANLPPPFHFLPSALKNPRITFFQLATNARILASALAHESYSVLEYDSMTAKEVLEHFGVHPKVIDEFWRFISMSILNLPLEECSGAAFFRFVRYLCGRKEFRAGFAKCGLGELFANQSVSVIEAAGGRVLTQARVDSLVLESGQVVGVKLKSGEELRASSVVSGLAPQDLSQLLNRSGSFALFSEKLAKFESCPYISIYLWFDRSLIDRAFWAREYQPQDLNCDFYDLSKFRSGWSGRPSIIASNIIYSHRAHAMSDSEIVKKTLHELSEFIPQANQAMLVHSVVNRIPMAIHCPRPGVESLRPKPLGSVANLILAGDWTDTSMPSSMESACHSGFVAAELILKQRKIPQKELLATQLPGPDAWVHWNAKIWNRILN